MSRIAPNGGYPLHLGRQAEAHQDGDEPVPWRDAPSGKRGRPKASMLCGLCGHTYTEAFLRKPLPEMDLKDRRVCALCKSRWLRRKEKEKRP